MRTAGLGDADLGSWFDLLDPTEKEAAGRFVYARHRAQYVAAHALARVTLGRLASVDPGAWRWSTGAQGKPAALLDGRLAPVSFNISHAEGIVGVAVLAAPDRQVGFDIEPLDRVVDLDIAERFFRVEEVDWLMGLPVAERSRGFMRLWTLKEAFIKATGEGLSRDLASFWFETEPPVLHFAGGDAGAEAGWCFEQKIVDENFVAAAGTDGPPAANVAMVWSTVASPDLQAAALRR